MKVIFYSSSRGSIDNQKFWITNDGVIILETETGDYVLSFEDNRAEFKAIRHALIQKTVHIISRFSFHTNGDRKSWYLNYEPGRYQHRTKVFPSREARDTWLAAYKLKNLEPPLMYPEYYQYLCPVNQ